MRLIATTCAGFLIAVLWMDLIFDSQVLRHRRAEVLPDPVLLALVRTVPNAVALGNRVGAPAERSRLARSICVDHLFCLTFMSAFLVLWMAGAASGAP
ncbi:MAG TPA: hypothetical protein VFK56_22395 [Mycobacterium sp.]|nr:hypothetical protein [Mycobacterium sp.]